MKRVERDPLVQAMVEACQIPEGLQVKAREYSLLFHSDKPYINLYDKTETSWAEFFTAGSIETTDDNDETFMIEAPAWQADEDNIIVRIPLESTGWDQKEMVWVCRPDFVEVYYDIKGHGELTECNYFGGHYASDKNSGFFASAANFKSVFNPEPSKEERSVHSVNQLSDIDVTGSAVPGREGWFFTPAPYCFGLTDGQARHKNHIPDAEWLMMGIAAPLEKQNFTGIHYDGRENAFSLRLSYEGRVNIDGTYQTPSAILHFTNDPYRGLSENAAIAKELGYLTEPDSRRLSEIWWKRPIFCGWGAQVELQSTVLNNRIQDFSRQETYDDFIKTLEQHDLHPGTLVIDDKWQKYYGTNEADIDKWPDLAEWISRRHKLGQKVLLWLKAWDAEGLPSELCVRTKNGLKVTADPSNPDYEELLRNQVQKMLGANGYNADGFKIDFTARTPSGRSLEHQGPEWGASLLHRLLRIIYTEAKKTKEDALVITHTPNPWFLDVTDMIRLNDINIETSVVPQMMHRAKIVNAIAPEMLIDTDNWPMPNLAEWRRYTKVQSKLGVPALYFVTHVGSKPLQARDYLAIKQSWDESS
jgi:hypothetical protein